MKDYSTQSPQSQRVQKLENHQEFHPKIIISVIILLLVGMFFTHQRLKYTQLEKEIVGLVKIEKELSGKINPFQLEERYQTKLSKIEEIANNQLGLKRPSKQQSKLVIIPSKLSSDRSGEDKK